MVKEFYETIPIEKWRDVPRDMHLVSRSSGQTRFCNDDRYHSFNPVPGTAGSINTSLNQQLAGPPNPKTNFSPVIIPPPQAFDYWADDYMVPSQINDQTNEELYLSGYIGPSTCGQQSCTLPSYVDQCCNLEQQRQQYSAYLPRDNGEPDEDVIEGYDQLYSQPTEHHSERPELVETSGDLIPFTYNPEQLMDYHLPSNYPAGRCDQNPHMADYNRELFTQIIEPNAVYHRSELIEPVQSNMGITFTQQFPPVSIDRTDDGVVYTSHDPRMTTFPDPPPPTPIPDTSNVYDPRSGGYGTSYRSYIDTMTGQPRFYYDDIDSVRRPNYIIRSHIDDAPWAHQYGPMDHQKEFGQIPNQMYREYAQDKFLQDTLKQRTELQERYMRKYNNEIAWQRRVAPLRGGR